MVLLTGCELLTVKPMVPCLDTGATVLDTGDTPETSDTLYVDSDGDGFGDPDAVGTDTDDPSTLVADSSDCDDSDASRYPGAPELCDGQSNDCDTEWVETDEAGIITWEQTSGVMENLEWSGAVSFSEEGVVTMCPDDASPFSVNLTLSSPGDLVVRSLPPGHTDGPAIIDPAILESAAVDQPVVTVTGGNISLEMLTLTGATGTGDGGALRVEGGAAYLLVTELSDNAAGRGGALFMAGGTATLEACTLSNNTAGSGGAIYSEKTTLTLHQLTIEDNSAESGPGGAAVFVDSTVTVTDTTVISNTASTEGGGFYQDGGEVRCSQTALGNNTSPGRFDDNRVGGSEEHAVSLLSGDFSSGIDGDGCWFGQSVWTSGGGDYLPTDPFAFTCDSAGCTE